jgi:lambda family phage tail tape measure protein
MEQADARRSASAQKANSAIQDQQRELAKLIGQIDPAVNALARLDEQERKLADFRRKGLVDTDTFDQYNQKLTQQRTALSNVSGAAQQAGMSQRAYSAAMRNVPAQITDITTSLIGGQPAYLVAIQQGGQLKDMFGGIVPAARALGSTLLSMINPLTLAAAAVAAFGYAWYQAAKQQDAAEQALITTGRYAASSAKDLEALADSYDRIGGVTRGGALQALTQIAATGRLTGETFKTATEASLRWSVATGDAVDTVAKKFEDIAKDPVQALLRLNEAEHFLTQTQYDRIKALQDEGRQQEAVTEAANIYANVVNGRATEIEANLNLVSTAWKNIKIATAEAWDEFTNFANKAQGPLQNLADALDRMGGARQAGGALGIGLLNPIAGALVGFGGNAFRGVTSSVSSTAGTANAGAIDSDSVRRLEQAGQQWKQIVSQSNRQKKIEEGIEKIRKAGLAAGINELEIERAVTEYKTKQADIDAKKNKPKANSDQNSAQTLLDTVRRQIEANNQLAETGQAVSASERLSIQIKQRLSDTTNTMTAATRSLLVAAQQELEVTDKQAKARQQLTRDTAANAALTERLAQVYKQQQEQNEVSLMSIGRGSQASEILQRQLNLRRDYLGEVEKLDRAQRNKNTALSEEEYAREKALLEKSLADRLALEQAFQQERQAAMGDWRNGANAAFEEFLANSKNVAGQYQNLFTNAFEGATDALTRFVTTGKASFKEFTASILADLAKIYARQALVGLVSSIGQSFGPRITGFASGGYTGDGGKHTPAGIVHRGEVVWSQADVKAVGGPKRANAMRPTAGYASGGIVGGGGSSSPNNTSPTFEININMEGGTVTSQTQNGSTSQDGMQLVNMIKTVVSQWYNEQSRTGGVVYKQQRGIG